MERPRTWDEQLDADSASVYLTARFSGCTHADAIVAMRFKRGAVTKAFIN